MAQSNDNDWFDALPGELQAAPFLKKTKAGDIKALSQVVADLEGAAQLAGDLSKSHVKLPGEGELDEFRAKLGEKVPGLFESGAPGEYQLPEDIEVPQEMLADAKELGLSQSQFDTLLKRQVEKNEAYRAQAGEAQAALKSVWGADYESNQRALERFLSADGVPERYADAFIDGTLDPAEAQWLLSLADQGDEGAVFSADRQFGSKQDARSPVERIGEIQAQLREMRPGSREYEAKLSLIDAIARGAA